MFKEIQTKKNFVLDNFILFFVSELPITFSDNKRFKNLSEARSESEPLEQ